MANLSLAGYQPQEMNYLRQLIASGQITEEDLQNSTLSAREPQNALAQMIRPQQEAPQPSYNDALHRAVPGAGFQDLQSGQGVVQQTNADGSQGPVIRINSQPSQNQDLSAMADVTRPIEIAGQGKGYYSKDGRSAIINGQQVMLGYNREATQANQDRALEREKMQASIAHTNEQIASSQQQRNTREMPKPIWDADRGVFIMPPTGDGGPTVVPVKGLGEKPQKPTEGYMKQQSGVTNVISALDSYKTALADFNNTDLLNPDKRANIETLYNNAMLQAKEAYNLGVLNGPDFDILTKTLTPATSMRGAITSKDALLKQVDTLQELMRKVGAGSAAAHGQPVKTPPAPEPVKPTGKPTAGTVQGGYVFMGGNPADPNRWKRQ